MRLLAHRVIVVCLALLFLAACDADNDPDSALQQRVSAAIASASDLPSASLAVTVAAGVVTVSGSLDCDECGGSQTPGGTDTTQQSLGAVLRAVPGVEEIVFELH